jgi:ribonuclease HII
MSSNNNLKNFDLSFIKNQYELIAGIDEAGRGPLAGPVVAAAVIFDKSTVLNEVNDSKKLSEKKREFLYDQIINSCVSYGIGIIDHIEIDKINILQASLKAMQIAIDKLSPQPDFILIDGNKKFYSEIPTETIIKGDSKSFAIAAASIIAKVTRDRIMIEAAKEYPDYLWERNKGYATRAHINAIKKFGSTTLHRKTFLSRILEESKEQPVLKNI